MDQQSFIVYEGIVVPAKPLREQQRKEKYGTIEDLPDDELADPDELERIAYIEMWAPILALPQQRYKHWMRPNIDEDGKPDWGAFGTEDFHRCRGDFDRLRYKADRLMDKQCDLVIMFEVFSERIPGATKYKILRLVKNGIIDVDDIEHWDTWQLAKLYMKILRIQRERYILKEKSRQRRQKQAEAIWRNKGC